jgi:hypothetical protein
MPNSAAIKHRLIFAVAPIISAAAALVYLGTRSVGPVIALFWLGLAATVGTAFFVRWSALLCLGSMVASACLLYVCAHAALAWSAWSIRGFAP